MKPTAVVFFTLSFCLMGHAQSGPTDGSSEVEIWTAGGHSVPGGRGRTGVWDLGLRYGRVLTDAHGPSIFKGMFEYAFDAVPVYLIFQPANVAYGAGLNPLNLKWNFATRHQFLPYVELSGGFVFTTQNVPPQTANINFTPAAAVGVHILRKTCAWAVEARYLHISDAGLSRLNPGINTFEVRLGLGKFRLPKN